MIPRDCIPISHVPPLPRIDLYGPRKVLPLLVSVCLSLTAPPIAIMFGNRSGGRPRAHSRLSEVPHERPGPFGSSLRRTSR